MNWQSKPLGLNILGQAVNLECNVVGNAVSQGGVVVVGGVGERVHPTWEVCGGASRQGELYRPGCLGSQFEGEYLLVYGYTDGGVGPVGNILRVVLVLWRKGNSQFEVIPCLQVDQTVVCAVLVVAERLHESCGHAYPGIVFVQIDPEFEYSDDYGEN